VSLLRKFASLIKKSKSALNRVWFKVFCSLFQDGIHFEGLVSGGDRWSVSCTDGGEIYFGKDVSLGRDVKIVSQGACVKIGGNSYIGDGVLIISKQEIIIGNDTLIAEYVVIRDQNHSIETRPIRESGFECEPILIGSDVWIGTKSTVLKGAGIESGCVIGAHALVNSKIPARSLAVGCPAKVVKIGI
jgi:acetyltransferase-like isoleucine patch superfamily enzyme